jgi:hypothetical protein
MEGAHPGLAELVSEFVFEGAQDSEAALELLDAERCEDDVSGASVVRVGDLGDEAEAFEVIDELADGLLGDVELVREGGDADAGGLSGDMREELCVGGADDGGVGRRLGVLGAGQGALVEEASTLEEELECAGAFLLGPILGERVSGSGVVRHLFFVLQGLGS